MKIYLVGGAIRDKLLGLPIKERDWVVVGATPETMLNLGYRQVGKEFPVFLHPKTNEEYALARMERKTRPGYQGFVFDTSPDVTLEADLQRRDLTINAMAEDESGHLIDPYHGKQDLHDKLLRHISPAFAEDPVRILRVSRFLARYAHLGFNVAPETMVLMHNMTQAGEVDALVAERVWKELERALGEKNPEKFFAVLANCGALPKLFPGLDINGPGIKALEAAAQISSSPVIRFAALLHCLPDAKKTVANLCHRYRVPNKYRELAKLTQEHNEKTLKAQHLSSDEILSILSALDIFRREERFNHFLTACQAIAKTRQVNFDPKWLQACAKAAKSVNIHALIAQGYNGSQLAKELKQKRLEKIETWVKKSKS
ncbi:MAG: multifunctional CCA addition/repair protein [Gammaproteobacteria bacterium]|nr:multifunctional CCA addition/repair protein [Gammaproteobacteria bacterium]MCW5583602.1 multifunctional CCA addition/repair protein [Gammaproteobacteria bacterium]